MLTPPQCGLRRLGHRDQPIPLFPSSTKPPTLASHLGSTNALGSFLPQGLCTSSSPTHTVSSNLFHDTKPVQLRPQVGCHLLRGLAWWLWRPPSRLEPLGYCLTGSSTFSQTFRVYRDMRSVSSVEAGMKRGCVLLTISSEAGSSVWHRGPQRECAAQAGG